MRPQLDQAAQDAAWVLAFRQGTRDSTTASRLLGVRWAEERSWSTGRETREHWRVVEQPYVSASALEDLEPGTAHLRVPSVDGRRTRVEHVRVALSSVIGAGKVGKLTQWPAANDLDLPETRAKQSVVEVEPLAIAAPRDADRERVLRRLAREGEQDGECRLWPVAGCNDQGYPKVSVGGQVVTVHKWLWERENGPVPKGWDLEHTCHTRAKARGECAGGKTCRHRRCSELEHLEAMPHGENTSGETRRSPVTQPRYAQI